MTLTQEIITIGVAVVATVITRFTPFVVFRASKPTPRYITYLGKVLPAAVFAFLVVYCFRGINVMEKNHGIPEIVATILTIFVHVWRRDMMMSIGIGTLCYMVLIRIL